jgi:hypothetical protein
MIGLLCFVQGTLDSPFKSKMRLEAENVVHRHQLIVLRRRLHGRARLTNNDRWFFAAARPPCLAVTSHSRRRPPTIARTPPSSWLPTISLEGVREKNVRQRTVFEPRDAAV